MIFCSHSRVSWPRTPKGGQCYIACLDCGRELPYSWELMRVMTSEEVAIAKDQREKAERARRESALVEYSKALQAAEEGKRQAEKAIAGTCRNSITLVGGRKKSLCIVPKADTREG